VAPAEAEELYQMESRLADGRVLYLLQDYNRAAIVLLDIVQNTTDRRSPGFQEARYYLAESLYQAKNLVGAQATSRRSPTTGAIHTGKTPPAGSWILPSRPTVIRSWTSSMPALKTPWIRHTIRYRYVRAKALYFQDDLSGAAREFAAIASDSEEFVRASLPSGSLLPFLVLGEWEAALKRIPGGDRCGTPVAFPTPPEIADLARMALVERTSSR